MISVIVFITGVSLFLLFLYPNFTRFLPFFLYPFPAGFGYLTEFWERLIIEEPERELVIRQTEGAVMVSPDMVRYEIANGLTKMVRKQVIEKERMMNAFKYYEKMPIRKMQIDLERALEIAWEYKIYAYDACYLESAKRLYLPLLTFDRKMARIGKDLDIKILGG
jgi:predicted nucleic acid-binding protein